MLDKSRRVTEASIYLNMIMTVEPWSCINDRSQESSANNAGAQLPPIRKPKIENLPALSNRTPATFSSVLPRFTATHAPFITEWHVLLIQEQASFRKNNSGDRIHILEVIQFTITSLNRLCLRRFNLMTESFEYQRNRRQRVAHKCLQFANNYKGDPSTDGKT
uniref:Uncharacterized protein n=1 Tax=Physcomitrium patens TaxID=3218 RepID=A0A2K1L065_PHYPA|nr:hypothetical protein PHYPA_002202 [Physcomitrium patens]